MSNRTEDDVIGLIDTCPVSNETSIQIMRMDVSTNDHQKQKEIQRTDRDDNRFVDIMNNINVLGKCFNQFSLVKQWTPSNNKIKKKREYKCLIC